MLSTTSFLILNRQEWLDHYQNHDLPELSQKEIFHLKKINNDLSINEIKEVYLPLSKLLNLCIRSNIKKQNILKNFFGTIQNQAQYHQHMSPYIIGIAGSVASGKSTTAKILQVLLSRSPEHHIVELVTTDSFLYSNQVLKKKKLMQKKGFPQSYNIHNLIDFIIKIKSGKPLITAPIYSHIRYDVIPDIKQLIYTPNILILEGLNVLQKFYNYYSQTFFSDFIDFSIYIDAPEFLLQKWYTRRFLKFCYTALSYPKSCFYHYSQLSEQTLISISSSKWIQINGLNLRTNILPTKGRANLILQKGPNHIIDNILLKITKTL